MEMPSVANHQAGEDERQSIADHLPAGLFAAEIQDRKHTKARASIRIAVGPGNRQEMADQG
jgi:hypothetical protein